MKIIFFLCSFLFFIINTQCVTHESYQELVKKLEALEDAVLTGYSLFHKEKMILNEEEITTKGASAQSGTSGTSGTSGPSGPSGTSPSSRSNTLPRSNTSSGASPPADASDSDAKSYADLKHRVRNYLLTIKELKYPQLFDLTNHMLTLCDNIHGFKYLIDGYEEINELLYKLNFYFDLLRAKLNDVCANDYCQIPFNLKIRANELDVLKKLVFGYRKPLDNIKDNVGKMEDYIKKNKKTIENINELIEESKKTIDKNKNATKEEEKKKLYQAQYDLSIYNKQLEEAHNLISVLEKRIDTLKKNENIKELLDKINEIKNPPPANSGNTPNTLLDKNKKIEEHEKEIKEIAKTIKFNIDSLFTDPLELEYYLREKNKNIDISAKVETKESTEPNEYPNGVTYPLSYNDINNALNELNSFGDLINPFDYTKEPSKNIYTDNERKKFINEIKEKIKIEKKKIESDKKSYEDRSKSLNDITKEYEKLLNEIYDSKFNNNIDLTNFEKMMGKRYSYKVEKLTHHNTFASYENSKHNLEKLTKALKYMEDYSLRNIVVEKELKYYKNLISKIENEIETLVENIKKDEEQLFEKKITKDENKPDEKILEVSDIVKVQVQKVLLMNKIDELKKTQLILKNVELKHNIHVPNSYKQENKQEPYYLIVLKKEIDKLKVFMPKVESLINEEKKNIKTEGQSDNSEPSTEGEITGQATTKPGQQAGSALEGDSVQAQAQEQKQAQPPVPVPVPEAKAQVPTPPAPVNNKTENVSKLDYLEKLYEFLNTSYICHKYILVSHSTMNEKILKQYKITKEEESKLSSCDPLDLLFNIQNNIPVMYSMFDSLNNSLSQLFMEIYEKEMVCNLYKLKDNDKIKNLLEEAKKVSTSVKTLSSSSMQPLSLTPQDKPEVSANDDTSHSTNLNNSLKLFENILSLGKNKNIYQELIGQKSSENFYEKILKDSDTFYNESFTNFVKSKADDINSLNDESKRKKLEEDINKLKKTLQLSFDLYNKYKLKLERLFDKKKTVGKYKMQIKKLTLLKEQLESKLNSLNNPKHVLQNFSVFFNKKKEAEIAETENTLENTKILLKHYKGLVKYYNGESSPLKTLSEESIQTEDNYASLENFKVLSKLEGKLKDNLNLEKKKLSYLSSGLHHLIAELKEVIKNKNYTGNSPSENNTDVNNALESYKKFLPEGTDVATVVSESGSDTLEQSQPKKPASTHVGAESNTITTSQNVDDEVDDVIIVPIFGESEEDYDDLGQVVTGEAVTPSVIDNILSKIENEYEVLYLKPLAGVYRSLKKQLENNVMTFNVNVKDILNSRFNKRENFKNVLESDLIPYKDLTSSNYVVKDPYKFLNKEKRDKFLSSYNYIKDSIDTDINFANDVLGYYKILSEKYKSDLDSIKKYINDKQGENEKYLPFLNNIETLYKTVNDKIDLFVIHLEAKVLNYTYEKSNVEVKIKELNYLKTIQDKLADFKKNNNFVGIADLSTDYNHNNLLTKFLSTGMVFENLAKTVLSNLLDGNLQGMLNISQHQCVKKQCPQNSGCFRHLDEREECKCLLNYKQEGDKCVENPNPTCNENNGGCDADAKCTEEDSGSNGKKITCECTKPDSYPLFDGIFCSSSNFLGISFLLILMLILYSFI
uniref:Merozoite surface protein 1 n=8 Tax=Plasmodium falciparum TaxID=5833 RepID=MSP1_PLAFK|nr:RecName: Full=Merozoite surface protein 1; AltName: Full=Merozoite surface antigen; AltName: Full=PMMSA; AltName: Full=p190; Contains: RecName: Full=p83 subunit; Contains: RecName: Full=p30 subunit; Contains: RecName: Full=p38 subunit; Contains: RecName: Full=p42 subunit; Contains: RecName: Full=p33 subunit; Contains: RecName: Full=p19 subunit; Flags: Precursor [Plasmodium falciparum K1]CAA27070.1 precursor for the major merozoite surface antigens [Plasmodium falciparum]